MKEQLFRTDNCIDEVVDKYGAMIYRIALTNVKSNSDADDVFQDVFLTYIKKNKLFNDEEHRKAWLIRTTIICCKKFFSNSWFKKTTELNDTLTIDIPEMENTLYEALIKLPEKYRTVLYLFYFEEMSIAEIHEALRIKPSTIRTQLTRGRVLMKEKLGGDYFEE